MSAKRGTFPRAKSSPAVPTGTSAVAPKLPTAPTPNTISRGGSMRSKKPSIKYK